MTTEDTDFLASDPARFAPPIALSMPPTVALTARFDVDASTGIGRVEPTKGKPDKASPPVGGGSRQGFRIGELRLMIPYEDASELSEVSAIHRLPNAPDWFCGIANLQGRLIPVFDLARYVGVEPELGAKRMLLVLSRGSDAAGVLIDGLPERLRWSDDEHTDAGAAPERLVPHLCGARQIGGRLWFDLDTRSLLAAIEQSLGAPR